MKNYRILAILLAVALVAAAAPGSRAQDVHPAPILNRANPVQVPSPKPSASVWLKAEVIHADANVLIVREQADSRMIHTFSYSSRIRAQMQAIQDAGGYHYGDKIKILWQPGGTVALRVRGKPSKSS